MSEIKITGNIDISDLIVGGIALISLLWLVISHVSSTKPKLKCSLNFVYPVYSGEISRQPTHLSIECVNINNPPITLVEAGLKPPLINELFISKSKQIRMALLNVKQTTLQRGESYKVLVDINEIRRDLHKQYKSCPYGLRYYAEDSESNYYTRTLRKSQVKDIYHNR